MLQRPAGGVLERRAACGIAGGLLDLRHVAARIDDPGRAVWRWLLVLEGEGRAVDGAGRTWELAPGVLLIRPQRTPHRIERRGPWLEFFLCLPAALAEGFAAVGLIDQAASCWRPADPAGLAREAAAWLRRLAQARSLAATPDLLGATAALLTAAAPARAAPLDVACRALRQALEEEPGQPVELLLRRHGDPDRLRSAFRERHGCTPKRWRIRQRLAAAADLLASGASAAQAAARLGWSDASAFGRQFHAHFGCPPGRWRRAR